MDSPDQAREVEKPLADEEERTQETLRTKARLQEIVNDLARYGANKTPLDLAHRLEAAIAEGGIPPQPHRWVEAVAVDAAEGRVTVLDARFGEPPEVTREPSSGVD
jgi:hypothetical protein